MKAAIKRIGTVVDKSDGTTWVSGWHFDSSNLPPQRLMTPEEQWRFLLTRDVPEDMERDEDEMWSVEELREIADQRDALHALEERG